MSHGGSTVLHGQILPMKSWLPQMSSAFSNLVIQESEDAPQVPRSHRRSDIMYQ